MQNKIGAGIIKVLSNWNIATATSELILTAIIFFVILLIAFIANWITKLAIRHVVTLIIRKTHNEYDDVFLHRKVFLRLSHLVPSMIIYLTIPLIFKNSVIYPVDHKIIVNLIQELCYIYMIIIVVMTLYAFLNAMLDIYNAIAEKRRLNLHLKTYFQVVKIFIVLLAIILIVSALINQSPIGIFTGLGALMAIMMLVFKDLILGFVASIQLSAHNMLKVGDWVTMPNRNADGDVIDITLSTVKIRNSDKSVTTIPTYALVSESFTNWQPMHQSGGRRIKRSIQIDIRAIKFCTLEMIERFKKNPILKPYIELQKSEFEKFFPNNDDHIKTIGNELRLTNLGVFREYVELLLKQNFKHYKCYKKQWILFDGVEVERFVIPDKAQFIGDTGGKISGFLHEVNGICYISDFERFLIENSHKFIMENDIIYEVKNMNQEVIRNGVRVNNEYLEKIVVKDGTFNSAMPFSVRQLQSNDGKVPIEINVFTATTNGYEYDKIQSFLFDHLFAILPEFELNLL